MNPSKLVEIRVPLDLVAVIKEAATFVHFRESVVFALASHADVNSRTLLLVRKVIMLPDEAYVQTFAHGAKWHGRAMLPILNEAMEKNLGIILFHNHPHPGPVALSADDRRSAAELLLLFQNVIQSRPHASVVFGNDHAAGIVLMPGAEDFCESIKIRWLGKVVVDFPADEGDGNPLKDETLFHRQVLLIGSKGQKKLCQAKVGVVGLCGGGSHVVQQLAHMGVSDIVGIDGDQVDNTNRSRMIGLNWLDVLLKRNKTSVMARMVRRINRHVRFARVPYPIPDQHAIDALKEVDIVVGCLDSLHARADLQDLTWRYLIPYVDIGLLIRPDRDGNRVLIGGHVASFIPGEFCQWCIGFLSDEKLSAETGGRPRSYFQGTDKQAQVISFNGVLASQAVSEVLQLVTGFAPVSSEMTVKKFNGLEGTLEKWEVKKRADCFKCNGELGVGDIVWRAV